MIYNGISKHVLFICEDLDLDSEFDIDVKVSENFKDVLAYLYKKRYEKEYDELSWYLEDGARDFYSDLENKWLHDEIDTFTLYHDNDFLEFLSGRVCDDSSLNDEIEDAYQDFLNECEWEARGMPKSQLKDLIDETCGDVDVEAYIDGVPKDFIHDTINLEDIYEDEYGDDEEEEEE